MPAIKNRMGFADARRSQANVAAEEFYNWMEANGCGKAGPGYPAFGGRISTNWRGLAV